MSNSTQSQTKADASEQPQQQQKPQVLEEDDEFEDFPVEGKLGPSILELQFP
jgi:26 proteasome complex subunit DSS1